MFWKVARNQVNNWWYSEASRSFPWSGSYAKMNCKWSFPSLFSLTHTHTHRHTHTQVPLLTPFTDKRYYYSSIQSVLKVRPIHFFPHSQAHRPYMNLVYTYMQVILCTRGGNGNPFQDSCLGYPMDRWDWWATVLGIGEESGTFSE